MSLINDALKQARKAPPRNTPSSLPPLQAVSASTRVVPISVRIEPSSRSKKSGSPRLALLGYSSCTSSRF